MNYLRNKIIIFSVIITTVVILFLILTMRSDISLPSVKKTSNDSSSIISDTSIKSSWKYFSNFDDIRDIVFDEDGDTLWVASLAGLHKYSVSQDRVIKTYTLKDGLPGSATAVLKIGNKIYIGSQGLVVLDIKTDTLKSFYDETNDAFNNNMRNFKYDGRKLWMSTFGGVRSFDIDTQEWGNYGYRDSDFTLVGDSVYLVDRVSRNKDVILRMDNGDGVWSDDFNLPGYGWYSIESDDKYIVAFADARNNKPTIIYYKEIARGGWNKLDISGTGSGYKKGKIVNSTLRDGILYFVSRDKNTQDIELVIFNMDKHSIMNIYPLVIPYNAAIYNLYPNTSQDKVWFVSGSFGWGGLAVIDVNTGKLSIKGDPTYPKRFSRIFAVKNGSLLINSNLGVGIFDTNSNSFKLISKRIARNALWNNNTIWLDLSELGMLHSNIVFGKYDVVSGDLKLTETSNENAVISFISSVGMGLNNYEDNFIAVLHANNGIGILNFRDGTIQDLIKIKRYYYSRLPVYSSKKDTEGLWFVESITAKKVY